MSNKTYHRLAQTCVVGAIVSAMVYDRSFQFRTAALVSGVIFGIAAAILYFSGTSELIREN